MKKEVLTVPASAATFAAFDAIIDTRSPAEYAEDHIPGAISAPVLSNEERAEIGTLYKQVSPFDAKKRGAALVAKNIAFHIENSFSGKERSWKPLVYCWRGGKRSGAMAHVLREIGWAAATLEGGYRAYRKHVVTQLERLPLGLELRVIHGPTGSGKSRLIGALAKRGAQVLDLEALAAHRGSVLGQLPDRAQPSQKWFESQLLAALLALDPAKPVFVEGESRKIGQVQVPAALIERMRASPCVLLDAALDPARPVFVEGESRKIGQVQVPAALIERMRASPCVLLDAALETRVSLLLDEYRHFTADRASLEAQLDCLVGLYGHERIAEWKALAARGAWREFVARLLVEHYDAAYKRSSERNFPRLAGAARLRIASDDESAFLDAAKALLKEAAEPLAA